MRGGGVGTLGAGAEGGHSGRPPVGGWRCEWSVRPPPRCRPGSAGHRIASESPAPRTLRRALGFPDGDARRSKVRAASAQPLLLRRAPGPALPRPRPPRPRPPQAPPSPTPASPTRASPTRPGPLPLVTFKSAGDTHTRSPSGCGNLPSPERPAHQLLHPPLRPGRSPRHPPRGLPPLHPEAQTEAPRVHPTLRCTSEDGKG